MKQTSLDAFRRIFPALSRVKKRLLQFRPMRRRKLCCGKKGKELGREAPTSAAVLPDLITRLIFTRIFFWEKQITKSPGK